MKIEDILNKYRMLEDDSMKIKSVSGNDVTIDQGGQEIKTTTDVLVPAADKPGSFAMKPADPNQIKPGAEVTQTTDEEYEEEGATPHNVNYHAFVSDPHFAPHDHEDKDTTFHKALNFLTGKVHPADMEYHAHHLTKHHHGGIDDRDLDEVHRDLISQGDEDVGGDPTGGAGYKRGFINDIVDKDFERKNRSPGSDGQASPINKQQKRLPESDELMKWLTIAGIK